MKNEAFAYRGSSMRGSLRPGDKVITDNSLFASLQPGDVIVYRNPNQPELQTIHRIIHTRHAFIATQGDNVAEPDNYCVTQDLFIGKATVIERNGIRIPICRGYIGILRSRCLHLHRRLRTLLEPLAQPLYELLGGAVIDLLRWKPELIKINIAIPPNTIIKYVRNGKTVAQWNQETRVWDCRKPYDLILKRPE